MPKARKIHTAGCGRRRRKAPAIATPAASRPMPPVKAAKFHVHCGQTRLVALSTVPTTSQIRQTEALLTYSYRRRPEIPDRNRAAVIGWGYDMATDGRAAHAGAGDAGRTAAGAGGLGAVRVQASHGGPAQ